VIGATLNFFKTRDRKFIHVNAVGLSPERVLILSSTPLNLRSGL
jgi:hypothetical protein